MQSSPLPPRHPEFDSAYAKYAWAVHRAGELEEELETFERGLNGKEFFRFDAYWDEVRQGFPIVVTDVTASYPLRLSAVLSDVVHNMRCVLDHVAWAMVGRGAKPPSAMTDREQIAVQFPITLDEGAFGRRVKSCLPGVGASDLALVRKHQPWAIGESVSGLGGRDVEDDGYWLLALLDNRDKHRAIELIPHVPVGGTITRSNPLDCILSDGPVLGLAVPMEAGQELAFVPARATGPRPTVSVLPKHRCKAAVNGHFELRGWMRELIARTAGLLGELSYPPAVIDQLDASTTTPFFEPGELSD